MKMDKSNETYLELSVTSKIWKVLDSVRGRWLDNLYAITIKISISF